MSVRQRNQQLLSTAFEQHSTVLPNGPQTLLHTPSKSDGVGGATTAVGGATTTIPTLCTPSPHQLASPLNHSSSSHKHGKYYYGINGTPRAATSRSPRSSPPNNQHNTSSIFRLKPIRSFSLSSLSFMLGSCFAALMIASILLQRSLSEDWSSGSVALQPASFLSIMTNSSGSGSSKSRSSDSNSSAATMLRRTMERQTSLLLATLSGEAAAVLLHPPRVAHLEGRWLPGSRKRRFLDPTLIMMGPDDLSLQDSSSVASVQEQPEHWQSPHDHQCIPKATWQTQSYPNCNSLHEINVALSWGMPPPPPASPMTRSVQTNENVLDVLGEGWFRTTWRLDRFPGGVEPKAESVVLKTLRIERDFMSEYYELHRRDAVAMERLTSSPFVVSIFGFCGQSAINELADFPFPGVQSLESFNRRMRGKESAKTNSIKLRMAASIALGLADIHAAGMITAGRSSSSRGSNSGTDQGTTGIGGAYMAHYDLNPRNIALFAGGRPKINDFNIAEFLRYNPQTNQTCRFPSRLHEPWWRAPEEMNTNHTDWVDEKVDVYALGNILFHTLTTHSARGKQHKDRMAEVRPIVAAGIRPVIPDRYRKSRDPNVIAMVKAINLCWSKDPNERTTSEVVASLLYDALVKNHAPPPEPDNNSAEEDSGANAKSKQDDDAPDSGENKEAIGRVSSR